LPNRASIFAAVGPLADTTTGFHAQLNGLVEQSPDHNFNGVVSHEHHWP